MGRIDKENYYLDIAQTVAGRSTCLRRCYGAILVKSDARSEALGATLYMACVEPDTGTLIPGSTSCSMCRRLIINAGIARVVIRDTRTEYRVVEVADWVREDDSLPRSL